jgi:hypothetical protein
MIELANVRLTFSLLWGIGASLGQFKVLPTINHQVPINISKNLKELNGMVWEKLPAS